MMLSLPVLFLHFKFFLGSVVCECDLSGRYPNSSTCFSTNFSNKQHVFVFCCFEFELKR